jgi:hypothetical protein
MMLISNVLNMQKIVIILIIGALLGWLIRKSVCGECSFSLF